VVVYDQGGTFMATRLFFALYHHGYPAGDLFLLDGGLAKWQEHGLPVTAEATPAPGNGSFRIRDVREDVRVRLPEFLAASGDLANNALVEALEPDWHFGELLFFGRPGHVPNGIMLPSPDFFNPDKTFKSPDEIRRMVTHLGIRPEQSVHTYCGGGVAASVPFFALKFLLDYPKVALFQESLMGWVSDGRELPLWTYDRPLQMRDASWLQAWGGQRLRMYGISNVSIVDVRPATAFDEGHVPFALNIPPDALRAHVAAPDTLTGILGQAGVNPSHEAVVVSGAGLTRDAALAFVLLERLGQHKVSVLMDGSDTWARHGLAITKSPTVVGAKTPQQPLAIPPVTYAAAPRADVIITDPKNTRGVYPKLFVASGATVPARAQDGKVVHVPYTSLLNADGTPKPAKDIWTILSKAGISRYAELICYAEDPGEAAANYYLLKLMGFPDVKVMVM
jgi:3-mercaptopyruvate sulfurtransferase SseA